MELIKKVVNKLVQLFSTYTVIRSVDGVVLYSNDPRIPMPNEAIGIWSSVEADAWSRNYSYWQYVTMCTKQSVIPLSEYSYKAIYETLSAIRDNDYSLQAFNNNMKPDTGVPNEA